MQQLVASPSWWHLTRIVRSITHELSDVWLLSCSQRCTLLLKETKDFLTTRAKKTNDNYYRLQEKLLVSLKPQHTGRNMQDV